MDLQAYPGQRSLSVATYSLEKEKTTSRRNVFVPFMCTSIVFCIGLTAVLIFSHTSQTLPKHLVSRRVIGNPDAAQDTYGIGIRVGLYLQSIAGMIIMIRPLRSPAGGPPMIFSTVIFISVLAAWCRLVIKKDISAAETLVICNILGTNMTTVGTSIINSGIRGNALGLVLYNATSLWFNGVFMWFWPVGRSKLPKLDTINVTWFFTRVSIDGWYWKMMAALTALSSFLVLFSVYNSLTKAVIPISKWWWNDILDDDEWTISGEGRSNLASQLLYPTVTGLIMFPFFVATAEMTIQYNNLEPFGDMGTPGQLIPFVAGLASLVDSILFCCRPPKQGEKVITL
ncbi:hypothetical protein M501DRAFT_789163 [Patellaria atrata CBS 101060]|uniref:Uncharacterized protein n=1 Tax=Patellaria atrata CBS 101060 TaxID=1346257 RepID=A0A9P4SCP0_9PEZI|nr:hypothetical protein M501DRAFT_789163 [Patellaria atrata CBS 101060]